MTRKVDDPEAAARNLIEPIGLALWGSSWKAAMAEALGVSRDTVTDWTFGRMHPRPGVYRDLLRVAQDRRDEISRIVILIKTHIDITVTDYPGRDAYTAKRGDQVWHVADHGDGRLVALDGSPIPVDVADAVAAFALDDGTPGDDE